MKCHPHHNLVVYLYQILKTRPFQGTHTNVTVIQWPQSVSDSLPEMVHQQFTLISNVVYMPCPALFKKVRSNCLCAPYCTRNPCRNTMLHHARAPCAKEEIYSHKGMIFIALTSLRFNSLGWSVTPIFLDRWFSLLIFDRLRKNKQKTNVPM